MTTRGDLSEILRVLDDLRANKAPNAPMDLIDTIVRAESINIDNRRVALGAVGRLIDEYLRSVE